MMIYRYQKYDLSDSLLGYCNNISVAIHYAIRYDLSMYPLFLCKRVKPSKCDFPSMVYHIFDMTCNIDLANSIHIRLSDISVSHTES